ncbi:hypothetical protein GCM10020219_092690 [Nonomuraea dietziae]
MVSSVGDVAPGDLVAPGSAHGDVVRLNSAPLDSPKGSPSPEDLSDRLGDTPPAPDDVTAFAGRTAAVADL